jgi:hypothetical protein
MPNRQGKIHGPHDPHLYLREENIVNNEAGKTYSDPLIGNMAGAMNSLSAGTQANREPKASQLLHAIQQMESVLDRLCALRDMVEQGNIPRTEGPQDCPAPFEPSVANLLSEGPQVLQGQHNRMMDVITQIESTLF